jgi:hypothetical protein
MLIAVCFFCIILLGCGAWESATAGKASCSFGTFDDFLPSARRPVKMASGNNGNNLYILDASYYVHSYKKDNLYECAFDLDSSYHFNGLPNDVFSVNDGFYVQDREQLRFMNGTEVCNAKNGVFAIYGDELAVGSDMGIEVWNINSCTKKTINILSQKVLALATTNGEYFAAEGISAEPRNLTMYSKSGGSYSDPMSSTPGNEKNFCSSDRIVANNYGVYLLDRKCGKIGVYDNRAVWRKTIKLDSLGVKNSLDIAPGEHSYIFILHTSGVEKINVF